MVILTPMPGMTPDEIALLPICGRPAPGKGKHRDCSGAWSDAVICPAFNAAGR